MRFSAFGYLICLQNILQYYNYAVSQEYATGCILFVLYQYLQAPTEFGTALTSTK